MTGERPTSRLRFVSRVGEKFSDTFSLSPSIPRQQENHGSRISRRTALKTIGLIGVAITAGEGFSPNPVNAQNQNDEGENDPNKAPEVIIENPPRITKIPSKGGWTLDIEGYKSRNKDYKETLKKANDLITKLVEQAYKTQDPEILSLIELVDEKVSNPDQLYEMSGFDFLYDPDAFLVPPWLYPGEGKLVPAGLYSVFITVPQFDSYQKNNDKVVLNFAIFDAILNDPKHSENNGENIFALVVFYKALKKFQRYDQEIVSILTDQSLSKEEVQTRFQTITSLEYANNHREEADLDSIQFYARIRPQLQTLEVSDSDHLRKEAEKRGLLASS